ncbi:MAG: pyruvate kinase [Ruminococcaceae bacterium]|nr:pyruvate kinase [Oscillospiraceae bacterium]
MLKTKIVCTIGPASKSEKVMTEMMKAGMNVARLNFSHGDHETHKEVIETFRRVRKKLDKPAAIMLDTKGPEVRIGNFADGKTTLNDGELFTLTANECEGDNKRVSVTYSDLPSQLHVGDRVLIDDGRIEMTVESINGADINCRVVTGGEISNRKGVNIPNVHLDLPYLSDQDMADLRFGVEMDVDYIAASFVRSADDVITMRNFLDYYGGHNIKIIAKIENMEGIDNFEEILHHANGIMVARGDMGVEVGYERLPGLQKRFIRRCYQSGKIVITATQMLESMIHRTTPTRAEITDVANAVFDGTSAVMLSGETAMGDHPARVVRVMGKIAAQAEKDAFEIGSYRASAGHERDAGDATDAICDAACTTARDLNAAAILTVTKSGYTAQHLSKFRPAEPIVAATPNEKTYNQLALCWGVYPIRARYQADTNVLVTHAIDCAKRFGYVKVGDRVVVTAGGIGDSASTDVLKVQFVPAPIK